MRLARITIMLELFDDQAWDGKHEMVGVYAAAESPHEALSAAIYELLDALQQQGHALPGLGRRCHRSEPAAAGLTEEQKDETRKRRKEENDQKHRVIWEE